MTRLLPLFAALALTACATLPRANPLVNDKPGQPMTVPILAAQYTVPGQLQVTDHETEPGVWKGSFVDNVTRCEGWLHFETLSNGAELESWMNQIIDEESKAAQQKGFSTKSTHTPTSLLGKSGRTSRLVIANPSDPKDSASVVFLSGHVTDQKLALASRIWCNDEGLVDDEVKTVAAIFESQKR